MRSFSQSLRPPAFLVSFIGLRCRTCIRSFVVVVCRSVCRCSVVLKSRLERLEFVAPLREFSVSIGEGSPEFELLLIVSRGAEGRGLLELLVFAARRSNRGALRVEGAADISI